MKIDNKGGYVRFFRSFLEWEWWDDINTFRLFSYLLLSVAFTPYQYKGKKYPAGTLITTLSELSQKTGLSPQSTRTSLKKLEKTKEILKKSTNEKTLITIVKWRSFQSVDGAEQQTTNKRLTNEQQTTNKPPYEEFKNVINNSLSKQTRAPAREEEKSAFGKFDNVYLTLPEWAELLRVCGLEKATDYVERLSCRIANGYDYLNHFATIIDWFRRDHPTEIDMTKVV